MTLKVTTKDRIDFTCPYCKRPAYTGYAEMSNGIAGHAVAHTEPMCKEFLESDPHEYIRKASAQLSLKN